MSASSALPSTCPQCGAALSAEATEGLCPRCLLSQAMHTPPATQPAPVAKPSRAAVPLPEELAPHFPNYEILRILGRGGMGAVYLARQTSLNRLVAIKILPAELDDGENNFTQRFKNEAQAMAQLSHPGIVAVYDFGQTSNGLLYIVMEYIDGTDVALMVTRQGRLPSAHAMAITAHVCDALAYAHGKGIIHRDIKPSNIMIGNDGVVKVADFGLAKMSQAASSGLTQSGMVMGTLHFMAPEALMLGSVVDQRADIYAVGVMLYQMLTGKLPQGLFEMPSLQVQGLDPRYDGIVAKALREDRALRYQDANAMRHDLDAILTQPVVKVEATPSAAPAAALPPAAHTVMRRPPPRQMPHAPPPRRSSFGVWAALFIMSGLAAWYFFGRGKTSQEPSPAVISTQPAEEPAKQTPPASTQARSISPAPSTAPAPSPAPANTTPAKSPVPSPPPANAIPIAAATKEKPFANSLGMKFVPVPITGGPTDGQRVLFSIWETRVKDYEVFAKEKQLSRTSPPYQELPDHPVVNVSFNDATAYCSWLTERERKAGWLSADEVYLLPSDHEWSCAVGIGHLEDASKPASEKHLGIANVFPWGSGFPPPAGAGNYNGEEESERAFSHTFKPLKGYRDNFPAMAPVGQFNPNGLGLYDLGGNAWEWCLDIPQNNTVVPVMRGATFLNSPERELFSSMRGLAPAPTMISKDKSFRIVLATNKKALAAPLPTSSSDPTTNTLGMKFAPLPGTKVSMCIHETRRGDYAAFAAAVPSASPAWKSTATADNHPVTNVSWEEATAFCAWLSRKENHRYRLPTDREWSIAVGIAAQESAAASPFKLNGAVAGVYPWSKVKIATVKAGNYAGAGDVYEQTAPVMSFPANELGFFDLGGNVWEYCADLFSPVATTRVLRGASWMDSDPAALLSSCRDPVDPSARSPFVGFRVLLEGNVMNAANPAPPQATTHATAPVKPADTLRADKMKYTNKAGAVVDCFAWKGKQAAVLAGTESLDAAVMTRLVGDYDRVYEYYRDITGREPRKPNDAGKLAVTVEDDTSASGMSTGVGYAKIWVKTANFQALCKAFAERGEHSLSWFREFGLNTWYYAPQLSPSGPEYMDAFPSGYCVLMRTMAARRLGLKMAPPRGSAPDWDKALSMLVDLYLADSSLSFANTIATNQAPANPSSLGAAELFAAICLRLCDDHGGDAFLTKLWQEVGKAQPAQNAQDGIDTFILASCAAAEKDLSALFTTQWRWPMSASAISKANKRWKKP